MSDRNSYEMLEVSEDASFEEIQDARNRLVQKYGSDPKQVELVETAYDAILMDRLRMRQEGKLKVPERIRFPEREAQTIDGPSVGAIERAPEWMQRFIDNPGSADILWPSGLFLVLAILAVLPSSTSAKEATLQLTLAFGVGLCLYFLNRKERLFLRSLLITLASLMVGLLVGGLVGSGLRTQLIAMSLAPDQFAALVTFFLLWLVSCFVK